MIDERTEDKNAILTWQVTLILADTQPELGVLVNRGIMPYEITAHGETPEACIDNLGAAIAQLNKAGQRMSHRLVAEIRRREGI